MSPISRIQPKQRHTQFTAKTEQNMKKEFEHRPKNSPLRKGEGLASTEGMGQTRITSPLFLYECAPFTSGLAYKDFYLKLIHSVPSSFPFFCSLPLGWSVAGAGMKWEPQHPGRFLFLAVLLVLWCEGQSTVPVLPSTQNKPLLRKRTSWLSLSFV